ncbi:MAG: Sporulation initiation inhibitor protein Soj [Bacteroidetes bacterium ADurb.Bin408]|nr:MAG: Sporulation initiation inhibitor protein Soj [Bacteroidetes bacterium ADurb.Bin408]
MEIAVISGKGGTGKSFISAAFATLNKKVILADCDVDAANMHILFEPVIENTSVFVSGSKAVVEASLCTLCGVCAEKCRFNAIALLQNRIIINDINCDGCHLCARLCPEKAITMVNKDKSRIYTGPFRNGQMVFGILAPGEENSGRLVSVVREKAKAEALRLNTDIIIIDSPPGIGCPVISSITGADHAVIITEPTLSGLSDMKRVIEICRHFNTQIWVIINKFDLNEEITREIYNYCHDNGIIVAGTMVHKKSIVEYAPDSEIAAKTDLIFNFILNDTLN